MSNENNSLVDIPDTLGADATKVAGGLEGLEFTLGEKPVEESDNIAVLEILQEGADGMLTSITDLDDAEIMMEDPMIRNDLEAGMENLELGAPGMSLTTKNPLQDTSITPIPRNPINSSFLTAIGGTVVLAGNCHVECDVFTHALLHAEKTDTFKISYGRNALDDREVIDLISAIEESEARVELIVGAVYTITELMLVAACTTSTTHNDCVIGPEKAFVHGSVSNMETTLTAQKEYQQQLCNLLKENGLLTDEEIQKLTVDRTTVTIPKERFEK